MREKFLLLLLTAGCATSQQQQEEKNPCEPNPCGENTLCYSNGGIIGCECVSGFVIPEGGDPFDGCFSPSTKVAPKSRSPAAIGSAAGSRAPAPSVLPPRALDRGVIGEGVSGEIVRESLAQGGAEPRSLEENGGSRLQAGHRPGQLAPRRPAATSRPNIIQVDTKELFPDECLIHEDCEDSHFCNPEELKCHDACTLAVCGDGALCTSKLHRPVCSCPDGFEGNPYDTCVKSPSRVGMKFRRK